MSEKLCALRKIGGGMSEKVLWTNPNPTSTQTDGTQPTLSESISNYKYIKLVARMSTTNATTFSALMSVDEFKLTSSNGTRFGMSVPSYGRIMRYLSDTKINISRAFMNGENGEDNKQVIIYQVIGLK